jgi:Leucine-rich repeat (LRR) protein
MCVICEGNVNESTTFIDCSHCDLLTSLKGLENCKALKTLYCFNCPNLTSLEGLENCKALERLDCSYCPLLTSLNGLENCKALKELLCYDCSWLEYENKKYKNLEFPSNIKKLRILQKSFKKSLFRRRIIKAKIMKEIN